MDVNWFKARQKKVGVTAEDIAQRMGRNRSAVSHIYNGDRRMSLEWAQAFADVLQVSVDEVLARAGVIESQDGTPKRTTGQKPNGFEEADAAPFTPKPGQADQIATIARAMGGERPGVDVWQVKTNALELNGYMPGDFILVDTNQSEMCKPGDFAVAQVYNWQTGTAETVFRRFEPPVLVSACTDKSLRGVFVVDQNNVSIRGKIIASWRL